MLERNAYIGGHAASHRFEGGWLFDEGPHVSFTKDERIRALLAHNVRDEFQRIPARVLPLCVLHIDTHRLKSQTK